MHLRSYVVHTTPCQLRANPWPHARMRPGVKLVKLRANPWPHARTLSGVKPVQLRANPRHTRERRRVWTVSTARMSSPTRANAAGCETCATARTSSPTRTNAVECETCATARKSSAARTNAVGCGACAAARKSSPTRANAVGCGPCQLRACLRPSCLSPWSSWNPVQLRTTRVGLATGHRCGEIRHGGRGWLDSVPANTQQTKKGP